MYDKGDPLEKLEKMLDEAERAFSKLSFEDKVKNMNVLYDLIEAAEEIKRLRRARVMLFLRLIALILIFILCISYFIWHISM